MWMYKSKTKVIEGSYCSCFQSEFLLLLVEFHGASGKICLVRLCDELYCGWVLEGWRGWLQLYLSCSTVCAAPQSIKGRATFPASSQGEPTSAWLASAQLYGQWNVAARSLPGRVTAVLAFRVRVAALARKRCLSHGGQIEELLVAHRSFWDTALLSCLCLTEVSR